MNGKVSDRVSARVRAVSYARKGRKKVCICYEIIRIEHIRRHNSNCVLHTCRQQALSGSLVVSRKTHNKRRKCIQLYEIQFYHASIRYCFVFLSLTLSYLLIIYFHLIQLSKLMHRTCVHKRFRSILFTQKNNTKKMNLY